MRYLKIKIYGRVQGVFFRNSVKEKAEELGITGFARNELDGTVYIEAQGEKKNLEKFLGWCKKGPPISKVLRLEFEYVKTINKFNDFSIRL